MTLAKNFIGIIMTKSESIIRKNPWLLEMWKEGKNVSAIFWCNIKRIEKKYQKKYNNSKDDVYGLIRCMFGGMDAGI